MQRVLLITVGILVVLGGAWAMAWYSQRDPRLPDLPEGDQEVAWIHAATSGSVWERFVAGVLPPHHKNGTMLADPSLEPIWDAAEELNVPMCIHTIGIQISPAAPLAPGQIMGETYGGFPSMPGNGMSRPS